MHTKSKFEETKSKFVPDIDTWIDNAIKSATDGLRKVKNKDDYCSVMAHILLQVERFYSYGLCMSVAIHKSEEGITLEKMREKAQKTIDKMNGLAMQTIEKLYISKLEQFKNA